MVTLALFALFSSAAAGRLKVILMAGQSNMEGHGYVDAKDDSGHFKNGTLSYLVKDPRTRSDFAAVLDADGGWVVRDDVFVSTTNQNCRSGNLTVGFGGEVSSIGLELGFGIRVGDALSETVFLIKSVWGGKSLAGDYRPPSAVTKRGNPQNSSLATLDSGKQCGVYFKKAVDNFKDILGKLSQIVPDYSAQDGFELSAFEWHQGWNDAVDFKHNLDDEKNAANEYEKNLQDFVKDVRIELRDVDSADWPFIVGASGQGGSPGNEAKNCDSDFGSGVCQALRMIWSAQMAAQDTQGLGTVASVDSVPFLREKAYSPGGQGYHWWNNAETYYLLGQAMAEATLARLPGPHPTPPTPPPSPTPPPTQSCESICAGEGHCCQGTVSSYQHPSCAMGCMVAKVSNSVAECQQTCIDNDNRCNWAIAGVQMNSCSDCPNGCDASGGVQECLDGCKHGFASRVLI